MNQKKRRNSEQCDAIAQKPFERGRPEFALRNGSTHDERTDADKSSGGSRRHRNEEITQYILTSPQSRINAKRPAQNVSCNSIGEPNS